MVARLVRDQEVVGSSPVTSTTQKGVDLRQLLFVLFRTMTGLEGGGVCGSKRFARESYDNKIVRRKLNSPVGCSPGRAAKGASPVTSTKNRRSTFAGLRFFAERQSLDVRALGPKPSALPRKGLPRRCESRCVGKGGTRRLVKPRGTQRRALRLCSDAGGRGSRRHLDYLCCTKKLQDKNP